MTEAEGLALGDFFAGHPEARRIHDAVAETVEAVGPAEVRVTKSQVAFRRRRGFAWTWMPGRYLSGRRPPLVLSVALPARDPSRRWKEIVEPKPGRFMHHLELHAPGDVDEEVRGWLAAAWAHAGG